MLTSVSRLGTGWLHKGDGTGNSASQLCRGNNKLLLKFDTPLKIYEFDYINGNIIVLLVLQDRNKFLSSFIIIIMFE